MSSISTFIACPEVQETLANSTGYDNQPLGNVNVLRFLMSPINKNDYINSQINFRPNGLKHFVMTYGQRFLESQLSSGGRIICTTGDTDGITSATYEIDPDDGVNKTISFTTEDLMTMCQANPAFLAGELKKLMDVEIRKMETDLVISLLANTGNFASYVIDGGSPSSTFIPGATKISASSAISTDLLEKVGFNNMANEFNVQPWLFGGEKLSNYANALNAACCSATLGIDAGAYMTASGIKLVYSDRVTLNASNADDVISLIPGMVQMLDFNEFKGEGGNINFINDDALKQGVLLYPDPSLPILFDYRAEYKCTDGTNVRKWHFSLAKNYQFIFMPGNMFQADDQLFGINGVNLYRIVNS